MAKLDEIGKWSEEKLEYLRQYLAAYASIMSVVRSKRGWPKDFAYIDAFAGSVTPVPKQALTNNGNMRLLEVVEDSQQAANAYIDGSPLVALKTTPVFDAYFFNDKNIARIRSKIEPLRLKYPNRKIEVFNKDCNDFLLEDVIPLFSKKESRRAFVFVDPYGLQVKWNTIKMLGEAETFDVYINFPVHGVTRQLRGVPPTNIMRMFIDEIMGGSCWYSKVYKESDQHSLFENHASLQRVPSVAEELAALYAENLKSIFKFVSSPRIMRQHTNSPLYALILASQAKLAIDKMNEIYKRFDRIK